MKDKTIPKLFVHNLRTYSCLAFILHPQCECDRFVLLTCQRPWHFVRTLLFTSAQNPDYRHLYKMDHEAILCLRASLMSLEVPSQCLRTFFYVQVCCGNVTVCCFKQKRLLRFPRYLLPNKATLDGTAEVSLLHEERSPCFWLMREKNRGRPRFIWERGSLNLRDPFPHYVADVGQLTGSEDNIEPVTFIWYW